MAHYSAERLRVRSQRVRLLIDQKIEGVGLPKGSTVDLAEADARYLKSIGRVEFVSASDAIADEKPVRASR